MAWQGPFKKLAFITLDLEPDHCDLVAGNSYDSFRGLDELIGVVRDYSLPLTVFATGMVLQERKDEVRALIDAGAEIELHSYSHKSGREGVDEISRGVLAYRKTLGYSPRGYRAPLGMVSRSEIDYLASEGFLFDSSIFPSIFPGRFCNVFSDTRPFFYPRTGLLEIPISVIPFIRFPVALSYIQLVSFPVFRSLSSIFRLPGIVVIDFHLHDIFPSREFDNLPLRWKCVYSRCGFRDRTRGMRDLKHLVTLIKARGYVFEKLLDLYHRVREKVGITKNS